MKRLNLSAKLVLLLAVIAGLVSLWQAVLGDWSRAGCWCLIVLYWIVLTIKNLTDLGGIRK